MSDFRFGVGLFSFQDWDKINSVDLKHRLFLKALKKKDLPQPNFLSFFFLSHITLTIYNYLTINTYSLLKLALLLCHLQFIEEIYCNIFLDIKYINLHCALPHNLSCQSRKIHILLHNILACISGVFQLLLFSCCPMTTLLLCRTRRTSSQCSNLFYLYRRHCNQGMLQDKYQCSKPDQFN